MRDLPTADGVSHSFNIAAEIDSHEYLHRVIGRLYSWLKDIFTEVKIGLN